MAYLTSKPQGKANYGFDAPDIMQRMLASGVVLVGGGATVAISLPQGYFAELCTDSGGHHISPLNNEVGWCNPLKTGDRDGNGE